MTDTPTERDSEGGWVKLRQKAHAVGRTLASPGAAWPVSRGRVQHALSNLKSCPWVEPESQGPEASTTSC